MKNDRKNAAYYYFYLPSIDHGIYMKQPGTKQYDRFPFRGISFFFSNKSYNAKRRSESRQTVHCFDWLKWILIIFEIETTGWSFFFFFFFAMYHYAYWVWFRHWMMKCVRIWEKSSDRLDTFLLRFLMYQRGITFFTFFSLFFNTLGLVFFSFLFQKISPSITATYFQYPSNDLWLSYSCPNFLVISPTFFFFFLSQSLYTTVNIVHN